MRTDNTRNAHLRGFSIFPVIAAGLAIVVTGIILGLLPGGFLSKKAIQTIPSQNSSVPVDQ
jgi:hypothetical protein